MFNTRLVQVLGLAPMTDTKMTNYLANIRLVELTLADRCTCSELLLVIGNCMSVSVVQGHLRLSIFAQIESPCVLS